MVHPPSVKREGSHLRSLSLRARVSITRTLAWMLDSLVRVSRRAAYDHYASVLARSADLGRGWPHFTRGYNTPPEGGATFPEPLGDRPSRRWPARGGMHPPDGGLSNLGQVWSQALPFQQFHVLFDSLSKVLFIFRSLYLCAIGLRPIFSFRRNLPPV